MPFTGLPQIRPDDLAALLASAIDASGLRLEAGDIVTVCQKVVSKSEGRVVDLTTVRVSPFAAQIAADSGKDPAHRRGHPARDDAYRAHGRRTSDLRDASGLGVRQRGRG